MADLTPRILTTQYVVSCLPAHHLDRETWSVTVEYREPGKWAVLRGRRCLGRDGIWRHESTPSEREDEWLTDHRFTEQEALLLAAEWAPKIVVNGLTAADVLARNGSES